MEHKIFMKSLEDIDVKLMHCKSNFQWKLLAEKFEEAKEKIALFYGEGIPSEIQSVIDRVRVSLVNKKAELPFEDLLI